MSPKVVHIGKVILAGAGPGDPELLTLKALRYLRKADVVIVDRLVSEEMLQEFTRADARIIPVGKQGRNGASTPQSAINALLVEHALQGKLVVRLKGGDVSIFSNVLDELTTLVAHDIPYEIVPGITAALGAAAYAGIPLTARGYSTAVRFLTSYKQELLEEAYWQELARTPDTLVFYMSSEPLDKLVGKLLQYGIPADRWLAVIEQATTPNQRVYSYPIHDYPAAAGGSTYVSPALIIIGKVAELSSTFRWLPNSRNQESYFPPVVSAQEHPFQNKIVC
ncbi:MAG TPA: uroporphyrinogen-III C-methyltransferase [Puia sp.]|jgi:uroporphyrin-III C-methyltransferase/precorrin-2 dehydrogenase/sirohydrochlorin ferrochelatase/uroporphyrin-III C-methyltransferase